MTGLTVYQVLSASLYTSTIGHTINLYNTTRKPSHSDIDTTKIVLLSLMILMDIYYIYTLKINGCTGLLGTVVYYILFLILLSI